MDYHAIHGHDVSSFDLNATHRLPTVSAADALEDLRTDVSRYLPTGIEDLDRYLGSQGEIDNSATSGLLGFQKGQIIEIWGPPGSGKTSLGIQLACNALNRGDKVIWVDAFHPVSGERFKNVIRSSSHESVNAQPEEAQLENLSHFTVPSLAHFVALLCHPTATCVSDCTSLIVIDSLSALINSTFPRNPEARQGPKGVPGPPARRLQVLQYITAALQKLAATRDIAIVLLTQCATKMQADRGAALIPAINANVWEQSISTRLALFQDWLISPEETVGARLVGIQKLNGKSNVGGIGSVFAFAIGRDGVRGAEQAGSRSSLTLTSTPRQKRKLNQTDFEIADSEDEDYGWEDQDEMPGMPPQWQGSEDLLLGQDGEVESPSEEEAEEGSRHKWDRDPAATYEDDAED